MHYLLRGEPMKKSQGSHRPPEIMKGSVLVKYEGSLKVSKKIFVRESVKGTNACDLESRNTGSLLDHGCIVRSTYKAVTGHTGELFRSGSGKILMSDLDLRVLDHLIRRLAPSGEKIISPLTTEFDILVDWGTPLSVQLGMSTGISI